jgi:hypothetical protein
MKNYFIKISEITINIKGSCNLVKSISKDLGATLSNEKVDFQIQILISNKKLDEYKPEVFSAKGSMNFNTNSYLVNYLDEVKYVVSNLFNDERTIITIDPTKLTAKKLLKIIYSMNKMELEKNTILSYGLFWYIFQVELLKKNISFIHSGVFSLKGKATLIAGTGGCGKTSTLFKLLENKDSKYISEDFGIIDDNGYTYYNPKPVSIYATDMEFGQKILQNFYKTFTFKEKVLWNLKRKILNINPMTKALPSKLLGNRIEEKIEIENILYFVRNSNKIIEYSKIDTENIVDNILESSIRELKTAFEIFNLISSNAPSEYQIIKFEQIITKMKEVYIKAFKNKNKYIVYIPLKTKPEKLVSFLEKNNLV